MSISNDTYTLDQFLSITSSLESEKGVDKILNKVKQKIFGNNLNENNLEEFKEFVRKFTSLYYLMKDKFSRIERDGGGRYFEHLREVVNNVLDFPNPNTDKVLIALAHDSIEDTNKTFEGLAEDYGYKIALAIEAISKKSWKGYIDNSILDEEERIKNAKSKRNQDYFGHLESFDSMKNYILLNAQKRGIELSEEELIEVTINALDVKFADRIHNLGTQWNPDNIPQVRKKLEETKKYFLNIAMEVNKTAYNKIKSLILLLELKLNGVNHIVGKIIK